MRREDVRLASGTCGMRGYTVERDGQRTTAGIPLSDTPDNQNWTVECTPKGDDVYDLRIYDPELPGKRQITWSGKIERSSLLL